MAIIPLLKVAGFEHAHCGWF